MSAGMGALSTSLRAQKLDAYGRRGSEGKKKKINSSTLYLHLLYFSCDGKKGGWKGGRIRGRIRKEGEE